MGKRKNGEGSWGKRTINGVKYIYYKDPGSNGKFYYGKTQKEVEEKRKTKTLPKVTQRMTFGEYITTWLYGTKYSEVGFTIQPTTFDKYEDALDVRFFKYPIANAQLASLNHKQIINYLKALSQKYRRGSIQKTWMILKMALKDTDAAGHELLSEINFEKISIPTESNVVVKKKKINFTTMEDMDKLYNEAYRKNGKGGDIYGNASKLIVFIMYSGLRLAEGCGLKWKNVDFENEFITVASQTTTIRERDKSGKITGHLRVIDKDPKTPDSIREIPYLKRAGEVLKLMYDKYSHKANDYVFRTEEGKPYTHRLVEKTLERMLKSANCSTTDYTVHSLRHGYGSILYQQGVDIKTISELLGHSDVTTTANIYVDVTPNTLKQALNKVNKIIEAE